MWASRKADLHNKVHTHDHVPAAAPGVGVGGHALQEGEGVAHPVALVGGQHGGVDGRVDVDDLLQQGRHGAEAVPQHGGEVWHNLSGTLRNKEHEQNYDKAEGLQTQLEQIAKVNKPVLPLASC